MLVKALVRIHWQNCELRGIMRNYFFKTERDLFKICNSSKICDLIVIILINKKTVIILTIIINYLKAMDLSVSVYFLSFYCLIHIIYI